MSNLDHCNYVSKDDVKFILKKYLNASFKYVLKDFCLNNASNNMLGLMSDHWKLKVRIQKEDGQVETLSFFIKAISRTNHGKAAMANDMKVFDKEIHFYSIIKQQIFKQGMKPWSAKFVTNLEGAVVLEDLNSLHYKARNIFKTFDEAHTFQALKTLARFHSSCIIFEEEMSKDLQKTYRINDHHENYLDKCGYNIKDPWFIESMKSTLNIIKIFSKYNKDSNTLKEIEKRWKNIWTSALQLSDFSQKYRSVICHRDLWNNNILFHYNELNSAEPDDCLLVDFQVVRSQPLTGDVMMLLYCNLDHEFRENNINTFLNYYYEELKLLLANQDIFIADVISWKSYIESCKEQRLWGLITSACLLPSLWINEELTLKIFGDDLKFSETMTKNKTSFIKEMMETNEKYRAKILPLFEEIVERYCLHNNKENILVY